MFSKKMFLTASITIDRITPAVLHIIDAIPSVPALSLAKPITDMNSAAPARITA